MNPEQPIGVAIREARNLRLIIVVGLVLVLLAIVTAYIYYGMQLAKNTAPAPEVPPLSESEIILQALESAPVASPETFAAVNEALEGADVTTTANPEDILRAMGEPVE